MKPETSEKLRKAFNAKDEAEALLARCFASDLETVTGDHPIPHVQEVIRYKLRDGTSPTFARASLQESARTLTATAKLLKEIAKEVE